MTEIKIGDLVLPWLGHYALRVVRIQGDAIITIDDESKSFIILNTTEELFKVGVSKICCDGSIEYVYDKDIGMDAPLK